jgi:hypothetical protein
LTHFLNDTTESHHIDDYDHLSRKLFTGRDEFLYLVVNEDFACKPGVTKAKDPSLLGRYGSQLGHVHYYYKVQIRNGELENVKFALYPNILTLSGLKLNY